MPLMKSAGETTTQEEGGGGVAQTRKIFMPVMFRFLPDERPISVTPSVTPGPQQPAATR